MRKRELRLPVAALRGCIRRGESGGRPIDALSLASEAFCDGFGVVRRMLAVALERGAPRGLAEGGIPIGAALFTRAGELVAGAITGACNRATAQPITARPDAFRRAGKQKSYPRSGHGHQRWRVLVLRGLVPSNSALARW